MDRAEERCQGMKKKKSNNPTRPMVQWFEPGDMVELSMLRGDFNAAGLALAVKVDTLLDGVLMQHVTVLWPEEAVGRTAFVKGGSIRRIQECYDTDLIRLGEKENEEDD